MPRPDLARLGIQYRRIPVLSIGRDVYLDTRLILAKLEEETTHYPAALPRLGATDPSQRGLERLLASLTLDTDVFLTAARLLPEKLPLLQDPKFARDRKSFFPSPPSAAEGGRETRADAVSRIRAKFELLETTLLADGREWILGAGAGSAGSGPSLADIEAVWPFHWLVTLPDALPADQVSAKLFPRVYAWVERFDAAVRAARAKAPKPRTLSGEEAAKVVLGAPFHEDAEGHRVEGGELAKGQMARVWPTDTGSGYKDVGRLVGLDGVEVVIETEAEGGAGSVHLHAPRQGFRVRATADL